MGIDGNKKSRASWRGPFNREAASASGGGVFVEPFFLDTFVDDLFQLRRGDPKVQLDLTLRIPYGHRLGVLGGDEGQENVLALLNR
jgi:hypothetical protein